MSLILSVDDREKFVYPYLGKHFNDKKEQLKKVRLTVGDFAISDSSAKILAVFERKTLKDYSAGLKDGRYENVSELIKLRKDTGCLIVYIIENKTSYPSPTKKHGGIPFKNILASIDLLTFRSEIHVIWTKDQEHTAERLHDFYQRYIKIASDNAKGRVSASLRHVQQQPNTQPVSGGDATKNTSSIQQSQNGGSPESLNPSNAINTEYIAEFKISKETDSSEKKFDPLVVPQRIIMPVDKDDDRLIREMWHSVGEGLSYNVASIISTKFSVVDLVNKISVEDLKLLTYESGTRFASKIVKTLTHIKNKDKDLFHKLVSGIPRIGKASAQKIIEFIPINDLVNLTPEKIAEVRIDGKRITAKLENIKKYFNYKSEKKS